jgi:hypothetical protein
MYRSLVAFLQHQRIKSLNNDNSVHSREVNQASSPHLPNLQGGEKELACW